MTDTGREDVKAPVMYRRMLEVVVSWKLEKIDTSGSTDLRNALDHRVGLVVAEFLREGSFSWSGVDLFVSTSSLKMNASNSRNLFSRRVVA
jgi:hypothetical protein